MSDNSLRAVAIPEEAVRLAAQAELDYTVRCGWMKSRDEDAEAYDDELDIAMSHARLWLAAAHPVLVSAGLAAARADEREKTAERIAFAIRDESKRIGRSLSYAEGCADSAAVALRYAHAARLAEPKEQQT